MNPFVSIIIPYYNAEKYIRECVESCLKQTYNHTEIILVDDGSTDYTQEIVRNYTQKDIKSLLLSKNCGVSTARNEAIRHSTGLFIAPLDADDLLPPDSIAKRVQYFLDDPDLDMIHGIAMRYRDGKLDGYNKKSKIHDQTVMLKRSVFERFGGYYEPLRSKENKELWFRLGVHPKSPLKPRIKARKVKEVFAYYRKHDEQKHKRRRVDPELKKCEKIFNKRVKELVRIVQ